MLAIEPSSQARNTTSIIQGKLVLVIADCRLAISRPMIATATGIEDDHREQNSQDWIPKATKTASLL